MIHKLVKAGMLQPALAVGNTNLQVKFIDDSSLIVLKITDMRELGKEYMLYRGKNMHVAKIVEDYFIRDQIISCTVKIVKVIKN